MCISLPRWGYGVGAIYPYLAHESIREMIEEDVLTKRVRRPSVINRAIMHGVAKIAAKMGISTPQSYQSAQIFSDRTRSKRHRPLFHRNHLPGRWHHAVTHRGGSPLVPRPRVRSAGHAGGRYAGCRRFSPSAQRSGQGAASV
ncbi:MAG: glutamate synthase central domain-containing protein [Merdibacter sp.]